MPNTNDIRDFWPRAFSRLAASGKSSAKAPDSELEEIWHSVMVRMILMARLLFPGCNTMQQDDIVRAVIEKLLGTAELRRFITQADPEKYVSALLRKAGREMREQKLASLSTRGQSQSGDNRPREIRLVSEDRGLQKAKRRVRSDQPVPRTIRLLPVRVTTTENEADVLAAVNRILEELGFVPRE